MVEGDGLLKEDVTAGRYGHPGEREVRLRRSSDVDDVGFFFFEQLRNIGVPAGDRITNGQLLGHDRFEVADGAQLSRGNLLQLLDVRIRDLSTSNDRCPEAH